MIRACGLLIVFSLLMQTVDAQNDNIFKKEYADPVWQWGQDIPERQSAPVDKSEKEESNANPLGTREELLYGPRDSKVLSKSFLSPTTFFTFSFWTHVKAKQDNVVIFSATEVKNNSNIFQVRLNTKAGGIDFLSKYFRGNYTAKMDLHDGQWHHIAIVYAPGVMKFYKDGMLIAEQAVRGSFNESHLGLVLGRSSNREQSFTGAVTSILVYDYVLNASNIKDIYNKKLSRWNLAEGEGSNTFELNGHMAYEKWEGSSWRSDIVFRKKILESAGVHGKIKNARWEKDALMENALHFSGMGAYVEAYPANMVALTNRFTISCWIKRDHANDTVNVIVARKDEGRPQAYFELNLDKDGRLVFSTAGRVFKAGKSAFTSLHQWYHLAIRLQDGNLDFFQNGVWKERIKFDGYIESSGAPLLIGGLPETDRSFNGAISRISFFGKALDDDQVLDLGNEMAESYWKMDEKDAYVVKDKMGKSDGIVRGASSVYADRSSFGFVKKIVDPGAHIKIPGIHVSPGNRFTIGMWVRLYPAVKQKRTILSAGKKGESGSCAIYIAEQTGTLFFSSNELQLDVSGGFSITDTLWHHILITYDKQHLRFYLDRSLQKSEEVVGITFPSEHPLIIGNAANMGFPLKGEIAHVKLYNAVRTPEEVTTVVPPAAGPYLKLKRGIAFDRIQRSFPLKPEMEISGQDMKIVRYMGFDHVKVLFTANSYILEDGLNWSNMGYVQKVVDTALTSGLPVVICLHPEPDFKFRHLGNEKEFKKMLGFYDGFSKFIKARWSPDQVAFQLMTEPHGPGYGPEFASWNFIYRQMLAVTRKNLPEHTIVIPGNRVGNLYGMTSLIPVEDKNVYYSFTTHEPFQFSQNARFGDYMGAGTYWRDISYIPWPASPEIVNERMERMISDVKPEEKEQARKDLQAYGDAYYNKQWLNMRINHVNNWNDSYGGNLAIMVVEFGALDPVWVRRFGKSKGVYPVELAQYIKDLREALESAGIGWTFWGFNEASAVLNPVSRTPYGTPVRQDVLHEMLDALGLHLRE